MCIMPGEQNDLSKPLSLWQSGERDGLWFVKDHRSGDKLLLAIGDPMGEHLAGHVERSQLYWIEYPLAGRLRFMLKYGATIKLENLNDLDNIMVSGSDI